MRKKMRIQIIPFLILKTFKTCGLISYKDNRRDPRVMSGYYSQRDQLWVTDDDRTRGKNCKCSTVYVAN